MLLCCSLQVANHLTMVVPIILFMQAFVAYSAHVHCAFGLSFRSFNLWAHFYLMTWLYWRTVDHWFKLE